MNRALEKMVGCTALAALLGMQAAEAAQTANRDLMLTLASLAIVGIALTALMSAAYLAVHAARLAWKVTSKVCKSLVRPAPQAAQDARVTAT